MMLYDDTIAALATPPGLGGVGIVRVSGADAWQIVETVFRPVKAGRWRSARMRYGQLLGIDGHPIDEALAVVFRGPRSFTGEDVAEFHCHGGTLPLQQTLQHVYALGARPAEPGEFTLRAFINGRIDLAQAEATLDIIESQTTLGLRLALDQLKGGLSQVVRAVREKILYPLAYLTALTDFPEDDVPVEDLRPTLQEALGELDRLLAGADQGVIVRQGARAALVGRPNAGKSSLLNALLRTERAIVTAIPGTTRDTLEETANLGGIPVVLIDTAGITETNDPVERIGVERSRQALATADVCLLLIDGSRPLDTADLDIARLTWQRPTLIITTKADLPVAVDVGELIIDHPQIRGVVAVSSRTGSGLDGLGTTVAHLLIGDIPRSDAHLVTNPRHQDVLRRARKSLADAVLGLEQQQTIDLIVIDLHDVVAALGEITGENIEDDLLNTIFSRFCIGK